MERAKKLLKKYDKLSIVAKATLWFTVCSIIQKSISMLTTPIFTRLLSEVEYGLYSTYLSWLNIFTVCVSMRLEAGVFNKGMSKYKDNRDGYTSAMQGLTTVTATIALVLYLAFHQYVENFTSLAMPVMLAMFVELYFVPAYNFWIRRMRYDYKYKSVIIVTLSMAVTNAVFGLLAVYLTSGDKGIARIFSVVAAQGLYGIVLYIYNIRKNTKLINGDYWKYALKFNIPLLPHYFSIYALQHSDRIMIQKLCGYADVAKYSVVYNLSMVLNTVIDSINHAIIPWLYRELEEKHFVNIKKKVNVLVGFVALMLIAFILFAPEVMYFMAPDSYAEAVYVIPPVSLSLLFIFIYTLVGNVEFYYDYNKITMYVSICGAVLNIILNWIFIHLFGYIAAAYTTLVCYIVFAVMHFTFASWIVKKKENTQLLDTRFLLFLCTLVVIVSICLSLIYKMPVVRYFLILVMLVIVVIKRKQIMMVIKVFK